MIACSQPLAAEAGLEILRKGGNAADAGKAFLSLFNSSSSLTDESPRPQRSPSQLD